MPPFSILTHNHPVWHWDFLLDPDGTGLLLTWRILESPDKITPLGALRQPDHRRIYLDYSGPISDDRGSVEVWDQGEYELKTGEDIRSGSIRIACQGHRINGEIQLNRLEGDNWEYAYFPLSQPL